MGLPYSISQKNQFYKRCPKKTSAILGKKQNTKADQVKKDSTYIENTRAIGERFKIENPNITTIPCVNHKFT
ncbi:MAG: hypothetical protein CR994_03730 [Maribacter sp.]|nr:MAG: hypothetical protein CR994_03730 [Maribacter sp.]